MDIVKALNNLNESIKTLTQATSEASNSQKAIDEAVKLEIEQKKKEVEELLKRIKF